PSPSPLLPYTTLFRSRIRNGVQPDEPLWRSHFGELDPLIVGIAAPSHFAEPQPTGFQLMAMDDRLRARSVPTWQQLRIRPRLPRSEEHTSELQSRFDL